MTGIDLKWNHLFSHRACHRFTACGSLLLRLPAIGKVACILLQDYCGCLLPTLQVSFFLPSFMVESLCFPLLPFLLIPPKVLCVKYPYNNSMWNYVIHSKVQGNWCVFSCQILAYAVQTYHRQSDVFQLAMYLLGPERSWELQLTVKWKNNLDLISTLLFHAGRSIENELGCPMG